MKQGNKDFIAELVIFIIGSLIIQAVALGIYFFAKVDNESGLYYEVLELLPIFAFIDAVFNRCPICGKYTLTKTGGTGGTRYTLSDGACRNCGAEIGIQRDRELHETSYFHMRNGVFDTRITPIWENEKEEHNPHKLTEE